MRDFKKLAIWNRSHLFTIRIYGLTKDSFPKEELYGLISQIRRSSSSIPTNIAEGCGRNSNAELKRFMVISAGSVSEVEYQLILAKDLGYLSIPTFNNLYTEIIEIRKMLYSYIKTL